MLTPDAIALLAADPPRAAILLDVDGTLAPIVLRPEDARVPAETQRELLRLHEVYGLVACISGRSGADAERIVGVSELTYVGEHGLELSAEAASWSDRIAAFAASVAWPAETKRLTASFHFRHEVDEARARSELTEVAKGARELGLVARWGRKVLEIRPPVDADKGTAVRALLDRAGIGRALYAGDDTTDLDAFRALDDIEFAIRVAVTSAEGPPELARSADLTVEGPSSLLDLLRRL